MKLLYDARWILVENRFDGVSRYSYELAHALARRGDLEITWLIHDKRQLEKLPKGDFLLANDPNKPWQEFWNLAKTINQSGHKLVYSPFFMMGTRGMRYKLVLTIHDTIYYKFRTPPQWLPWHIRLGWRLYHLSMWPMRWQLNHANVVATVSDTAHDELVTARATKRQIIPVYNAVDSHFQNKSEVSRHKLRDIIYIGAFTPYKNVETLIKMMKYLPDYRLNLCGKLPELRKVELEDLINRQEVKDRIVLHGPVDDETYINILGKSIAAISASRIEGFGLPLIEAQCAGVPYVAADTPIFHEIGAESVQYFDPDNPREAANCIENLENPNLNKKFIELGHQNAARYTWDESAKRATKIIHSLENL